jgi:hypothetical protein
MMARYTGWTPVPPEQSIACLKLIIDIGTHSILLRHTPFGLVRAFGSMETSVEPAVIRLSRVA